MALTTFIAFGILERHPRLRVAFLETGAVWALPYLHRLDEHLEVFGFDRGALTMEPSDYFRRQCFVSVEEVEPGLGVDGRGVSRLRGVRVRLPARRRHVPGSTRGAARHRRRSTEAARAPRPARQRRAASTDSTRPT